MVKKGDTLIEVCIAIGIFSLIAIGVAAVMSSGTAGSQTALETTLAREEIDAQADALRFVHESYMNAKNSSSDPANDPYYKIWKAITTGDGNGDANALAPDDSITQYNPNSCKALYDSDSSDSIFKQNAFVLNTKELDNPSNALVSSKKSSSKFKEATTYPRLIFDDNSNNLSSAEGLYVIAVKDSGTDMVVKGDRPTSTTAFYDFYIRSCWYGTDADRPTSISTVIRLYDPPASEASPVADDSYVIVNYHNTNNPPAPTFTYGSMEVSKGQSKTIPNPATDLRYKATAEYRFLGWNTNRDPNNTNCTFPELQSHYDSGGTFSVPDNFVGACTVTLDASWNTTPYKIIFNPNGGRFTSGNATQQSVTACTAFGNCETSTFNFPSSYLAGSNMTSPDTKKFTFSGWAINSPSNKPEYGGLFGMTTIGAIHGDTTFYAIWKPYYWVDVNVFMNKPYGGQATGGYEDFKFKLYINGVLQEKDHQGNPAPYKDFYRELPDNSNIKVFFKKRSGYKIDNNTYGSICSRNKLGNSCQFSETASDYVIEFTVDESLKSTTVDSSGHYSVQIEPIWVRV